MDFFYDCVTDVVDSDDAERLAELYAMDEEDVAEWMEDMLDEAEMPHGELRNACLGEWQTEERIWKLYRHIQEYCRPNRYFPVEIVKEAEAEAKDKTE